jgi:hypothetical protein
VGSRIFATDALNRAGGSAAPPGDVHTCAYEFEEIKREFSAGDLAVSFLRALTQHFINKRLLSFSATTVDFLLDMLVEGHRRIVDLLIEIVHLIH